MTYQRSLDHKSGVPLHLQIREIIRNEALNENLVDETGKMATEIELMSRFGVSRITVRNALQSLVEEGLIVRERGRGTFLRTNQAENWVGRLMGFTETIREAGFTPGAKILSQGVTTKIPIDVKTRFNVSSVWELKRIRYANDVPIAIEHAFVPLEIGLELENQDLINIAMYRFLEDDLNIHLKEAKQMISAVNASLEEAEMLEVVENEALLYMERETLSHEQKPVEFLKSVYRPDYFQYMVNLSRMKG